MARRKKSSGGGDAGTWLNTYADMVTLLLTFFAVLLSLSDTDQGKFDQFIQSFQNKYVATSEPGGGLGEGTGIDTDGELQTLDDLYEKLKKYVEENGQESAVSISKYGDIVYIRFSSDLFFKPNQYTLLSDSRPTLQFIGEGIKAAEDAIRIVQISGHTASVPGKSHISDWRLSGERAATVAVFLEETIGFDPDKVKIEGYGKRYPVADNETEEGRSKNRRVELLIIGKNSTVGQQDVYESIQGLFNPDLYPTTGGANDILVPPATAVPQDGTAESIPQPDALPPASQANPADPAVVQ